MNMLCSPMYVARIELFSARCLLYVKMLPRAQKEIVPSQKHFLTIVVLQVLQELILLVVHFLTGSSGDLCKCCSAIAPVNIFPSCHSWSQFQQLCCSKILTASMSSWRNSTQKFVRRGGVCVGS